MQRIKKGLGRGREHKDTVSQEVQHVSSRYKGHKGQGKQGKQTRLEWPIPVSAEAPQTDKHLDRARERAVGVLHRKTGHT